jgi:hypothetical protein
MLSIAPKGPPGSPGSPLSAKSAQSATSAVPSVPAPPASELGDNRTALRRPATTVPGITGLRISPHGVEATLVNISETGVLAECGERLKPGSAVTVVFEGTFQPRTMEGRVARNSVSSMGADGRLRYHVGIAFARPIELPPEEPAPAIGEPLPPVASIELPPAIAAAPAAPAAAPTTPAPAAQAEASEILVPIVFPKAIRNRW